MIDAPSSLHYLALGDSYTIGEAVSAHERWPVELTRRLRQTGLLIDDPRIVAVTGWTTDELSAGMDAEGLVPPYDLVSLQIGVNNQYRGRPAQAYRDQFSSLLKRAIRLSGDQPGHVVVVSIPDWGVTPFAREQGRDAAKIAVELDHYNAIARDQCVRAGALFVDITDISRQHAGRVTSDGLHPSAAQYALWVDAIESTAVAALR